MQKRNLIKYCLPSLFFILLLSTSSICQQVQETKVLEIDSSLELHIYVENIDTVYINNKQERLINFHVDFAFLDEASYIYSPFSADDFYLPLTITLQDEQFIKPIGNIIETPRSIGEIDKYINQLVNFVRTNTSYKQHYEIETKNPFKQKVLIEFLLEPSCVPYDIEFSIESKKGNVWIKGLKAKVSEEYRK